MDYFTTYLKTFRALLTIPSEVIGSFLKGEKKSFQHPFLFCLTGAVAVVLLNTLFVNFHFVPDTPNVDPEQAQLQQITEWMQMVSVRAATQFLPVTLFLTLIVSLSIAGLVFLRKKTEGFYDLLIINTYSTGASFVILPVLIPVWAWIGLPLTDPFINSTLPAMLIAAVILWIYRLFFDVSSFADWLKILSSYIAGYIIYVIFSGFLASVVAYMLFVTERISNLSG